MNPETEILLVGAFVRNLKVTAMEVGQVPKGTVAPEGSQCVARETALGLPREAWDGVQNSSFLNHMPGHFGNVLVF